MFRGGQSAKASQYLFFNIVINFDTAFFECFHIARSDCFHPRSEGVYGRFAVSDGYSSTVVRLLRLPDDFAFVLIQFIP